MFCCTKLFTPASTPEKTIFPLSSCGSNYHTGDFNPSFADGRTSLEEINQVVNTIQVTHQPFVSKKGLFDFLLVLSYLVVVGIAVFIWFEFFPADSVWGLVFMLLLICIFTGIINGMYRKKILSIFQESKLACEQVLDEQYKESFELRGLRWILPGSFPLWVELHRIYGNQGAGQPIYVPPNMH